MPRITENISDPLFEKLRVRKDQDGFGDKAWTEWFRFLTRDVFLEKTLSNFISDTTRDGLAKLWMTNLAQNMPQVLAGKKIWQLPKLRKPALVVGAGPSIQAKGHLNQLADWLQHHCLPNTPPPEAYPISIIATDRMLVPCLKHGISPEYVVSVDGNTEKIVKWYDDPIVEKHALEIRGIVLAVTVAPNVIGKVRQAGVSPYFFVAMLDQFHLTNNITRLMHYMTDCTAVNCGGNAGSASWAVATYLGAKKIALIGLDYGYLKGTPIEETAYYNTLKQNNADPSQLFGLYFDYYNPEFQVQCYSDIMFNHYKEAFTAMLELADATGIGPVETINCTEGGILNGGRFKCTKFADFLQGVAN